MGATPNPKDRRVLRTRRTLREALVALLHERPWDDVSVQDVCARADVGRSTFYLHFADKEELLVGGFDDLSAAIRAHVAATPATPAVPLPFALPLFAHALDHRRLFRALVGRRSGQVVVQRFRNVVRTLVEEAVGGPGPEREAAMRFLTGAFVELLSGSLDATPSPSAAQLDAWYQAMAVSAVALASGTTGAAR